MFMHALRIATAHGIPLITQFINQPDFRSIITIGRQAFQQSKELYIPRLGFLGIGGGAEWFKNSKLTTLIQLQKTIRA